MEQELDRRGIDVEFLDVADGTAALGYQTHQVDSSDLVREFRTVVVTLVESEAVDAAKGAVVHTDRPVVGLWTVDSSWIERYRAGDLSETGLLVEALHSLRTVRF